MTFDQFRKTLPPSEWGNISAYRACWNAAVEACEAIVAERHDPGEPWMDPGDLRERVGVKLP